MNRKTISAFGMLAIAAAVSSCSVLQSKYYPGQVADIGEGDLAAETIWMLNEDVYHVHRIGSNDLVAARLNWNERKKEYEVDSFPVVISELGDHLFVSTKDGGLYTIFRLAGAGEEHFVLYLVDSEKMEQAIEEGKVKAHTKDRNIILDGTKEEQDAYLLGNMDSVFSMDHVVVGRMIAGKEEQKADKESP